MKTTNRNDWNEWRHLRARGRKIVKLRAQGLGWAEIGRRLDVSRQAIFSTWKKIEAGSGPYQGLI